MSPTPCDKHFLNYAVTVAARGQGSTAPNPSVGAVIVKENAQGTPVIVGEATTAPGGRPHAEPQAIAMAGSAAQGATLYVSLEPCNHHGQTPPCTEAIKAAGIARVVCALTDPDSRVAGQGLAMLQNAGISVDQVHVEPLAPLVVAGHILRIRNNRPFVRLKVAVSSDGLVAEGQGAPVWVTGEGGLDLSQNELC